MNVPAKFDHSKKRQDKCSACGAFYAFHKEASTAEGSGRQCPDGKGWFTKTIAVFSVPGKKARS